MVGQRVLVPSVRVRILLSQHAKTLFYRYFPAALRVQCWFEFESLTLQLIRFKLALASSPNKRESALQQVFRSSLAT